MNVSRFSRPVAVVPPYRKQPAQHEEDDTSVQSESKRRKVRKGTRSCWECKRRKMKCVLSPLNSDVCNACRRRGSKCIGQEFPEDTTDDTAKAHDFPTPATTISAEDATPRSVGGIFASDLAVNALESRNKHGQLSDTLYAALPSQKEIEIICNANRHPFTLPHEVLVLPYTILEQTGMETSRSLAMVPRPNAHPVILARYMLRLAIYLLHLQPNLVGELKGLKETPRALRTRLVDLAHLVTNDHGLLGNAEGLECVMVQSMYEANMGSLRQSWLTNRHAMSIAQLMGIHRPNNRTQVEVIDPSTTKSNTRHMWWRIRFLDCHLSLMLGLPQSGGSDVNSLTSDALFSNDTPMGRLERMHCVIASKISERNESTSNIPDVEVTREIDVELQKTARSLPSKWWLAPSMDVTPEDTLRETQRLFSQVLHYNLLNQLHLPYMLRSTTNRNYEYSRITCVNASRELLSRFIILRSSNRAAYSCRIVDFLALMAAMTLLLAHMDGHRSGADNLLAHQYLSDRAMIERAQENMEKLNRMNSDALSAQSADLLRRMLAIEMQMPGDDPPATTTTTAQVSVQPGETVVADPADKSEETTSVRVHIPYFGIIKIARHGMSKEPARPLIPEQPQDADGAENTSSGPRHATVYPQEGSSDNMNNTTSDDLDGSVPSLLTHRLDSCVADHLMPYEPYPGLAAPGEDWAFQGVDMAFFDSLMRNMEEDGGTNEGLWTNP
ncbi:hypothetical protein PFICI_11621 [Pestalotiopsis fici W106-1]|uniref:Zn(2)-C6 fungal-type domain-containing protein n=1 Tax=Pestalotiopsis fici (strain W106-1 / CGMCC3.15140) TaxID=1229662 RepID=W3WQX8_PESFW|nr:uncharacterized protein PFICI_11621 [Pestalotiopsis fici W106-1]ETS76234.1 hypothetical protein PFICI_11621 [Pestalotiopsis fici W106-1]